MEGLEGCTDDLLRSLFMTSLEDELHRFYSPHLIKVMYKVDENIKPLPE